MGDEEAKRVIFARRARFVAAALAGLNAAMCGGQTDGNPEPCLSVAFPDDGGTPQPCLSAPYTPVDASTDADAQPQPCLSVIADSGDEGGDAGDGG